MSLGERENEDTTTRENTEPGKHKETNKWGNGNTGERAKKEQDNGTTKTPHNHKAQSNETHGKTENAHKGESGETTHMVDTEHTNTEHMGNATWTGLTWAPLECIGWGSAL